MPRRPPAVARVVERVTTTAREHRMFREGETVLVSCSGGPDSTCLVYSLWLLRRLFGIRLEVFHLDHRLRADSAKDADYVARLATRLRLPFHLRTSSSGPGRGESVEAFARGERMIHGLGVRREIGANRVAEGHTLDDQAETILIALIRGGGLDALGGIHPVLGAEVQPLLDVRRDEVEAFCRALHLRPRRDPTNRDRRLLRNAVRLDVLPALERATGREVRATLARTTALLREDQRELRRQATVAYEDVMEEADDGVRLAAAALRSLPRAIGSRVVRDALYRLRVMPTVESIDAVLELAGGRSGRRRDLAGGSTARRDRRYVVLARPSPAVRPRGEEPWRDTS